MAGQLITSWRPDGATGPIHVAESLADVTPLRFTRSDFEPVDTAAAEAIEREVFARIPLGIDEQRGEALMNMPGDNGRHVLAAGASGAGKTTFVHTVLLTIARRRHVAVVLVDPKELDFAMWKSRAAMLALGEGGAVSAFAHVVAELNYRKAVLSEYNQMAASMRAMPVVGLPIGVPVLGQTFEYVLLIVDELETLTDKSAAPAPDAPFTRSAATERRAQLRRVLRLGRALGIGVLSATQRPSYDVVPLGIRDLHRTRVVFGTESKEQTGVAWGEGWQDLEPYPPHRIHQIGEGFMRVDRKVTHFQGYFPTPAQIAAGASAWPRVKGPASWPHVIEDDEHGGGCPLCGHSPSLDTDTTPRRKARR